METDLDPDPDHVTGFDRRQLIRSAALFGLGGFAASALGSQAIALPGGVTGGLLDSSCRISPSQTLGPYWLNLQLMRQDITEGLPGLILYTHLRVVQPAGRRCEPVPGAIVDVWHANAPGAYSGFSSQGTLGQTWLRGIQPTNANGVTLFRTIYPGWYPGRTTHIHLRVLLNQQYELTSQLYFPDSVTSQVYQQAPYSAHGPSPTMTFQDGFFDPAMLMTVLPGRGGAYVAGKTIVID